MVGQVTMNNWGFLRKYHDKCTVEVGRDRCVEPCDKPAVAVAHEREGDTYWPVCKKHARNYTLVPLPEVIQRLERDD